MNKTVTGVVVPIEGDPYESEFVGVYDSHQEPYSAYPYYYFGRAFQETLGGYFEIVRTRKMSQDGIVMLVNEDGHPLGLRPNITAFRASDYPSFSNSIVGPAIFLRYETFGPEESFESLSLKDYNQLLG